MGPSTQRDEIDASGPFSPLQDDVPSAVETADDDPARSDGNDQEDEVELRIAITGRLGCTSQVHTTRNDTVVASFPVAVLEEDGSTT